MREGWEIRRLGDVCDLYQPKTISTDMLVSDGKYLVYGANGIIGRYNEYNHEQPEVLMTCRGATCGSINISKPFSWINGNAMVVHPKQNNLGQTFLKYLLQSIDLSCVITGAAQPQITRQSLKPVKVVVPPIAEQEKIVAELDCLSGIVEKKKQQLEELDKLAQSIFYDMFGDPITNEKGWPYKSFGQLYDVKSSKRLYQSELSDRGVPFYKIADIVDLINGIKVVPVSFVPTEKFSNLKQSGLVPQEGDILLTSRGTLGMCYIISADDEFYFQDGMITWFSNGAKDMTPLFVKYLFKNDEYNLYLLKHGNFTTVAYISINQLKGMLCPIPPRGLQNEFAEKVEAIEKQKELVKQSIVETETLINSRMDYWFN